MTNAEAVVILIVDMLGRRPTPEELSVIINVLVAFGVDADAEFDPVLR
jgi:hypothetical protein